MSDLKQYPCPKCKGLAEKKLSAGRFSFSFVPDGPRPQNTGATSIDHDPDRTLGESAKRNTHEYQIRSDYKKDVIRENGLKAGDYLSREEDGDYFIMTDQERVAAKKARLLNQEATAYINDHIRRVSAR